MNYRQTCWLLLILVLLSGCSGARPYSNTGAKNLLISAKSDSGSVFSKIRVSVDIYSVDAECQTAYRGSLALKSGATPVALPVSQDSYLVFVFASSGFLANSSGQISYDSLLKPQPQAKYSVDVSYMDDIYNVRLQEKLPQDNGYHEISPRELKDCSR